MMDPNRTIRAPSTVIKSSRSSTYNGSLAQTKFRVLNPAGLIPLHQTAPKTNKATTTISTTSRLPTKTSGLIKPTSLRHIISAASSTSIKQPTQSSSTSIKQPAQSSSSSRISNSGSKVATLKLATLKRPTALNSKSSQNSLSATDSASSTFPEQQIFNSLTGDVGEIRRLLEQLLGVIKGPTTNETSMEMLAEENERLRREVARLKDKIAEVRNLTVVNSMDSTIITEESRDTRPSGSNIFFTPMN